MREILQASFICRFFNRLFSWFDGQVENSLLVTTLLSAPKSEENVKYSLFSKIWTQLHRFISFIYEKLRLEKLLTGSIFLNSFLWCTLTCVFAPVLPTSFVIALAGLTVLSMAISYARDKERKLEYSPINKYIFIFIGIYIFSIITSLAMREGLLGGMVFVFFTFFAVTVQHSIRTEKQVLTVVGLMIIAGTLVSAYGIVQYVLGMAGSMDWLDSDMFENISMRVYSTLQNPNVLAEYLLLITPLTVGCFFMVKPFKMKLLCGVAAAIMGVCMILTFSRGGWLGLLFAAAVYLVIIDKRFIFLGIVGIVALYFLMPDAVIERFTSIGNMADTSTAYRVYIWMGTIRMLGDYWLCGTGFGEAAFSKVYPAYALHAVSAPHAHNLFLQITCDTGITGIIVFLIILYMFFKTVSRAIKYTERKDLKNLLIGFVSAVCGFLVQSMTDYTFYNYRVMLVFWIVIAMGIVTARISMENNNESQISEGETGLD